MTISKSDIDSYIVKGGVNVSTQLVVNKGKNMFVPRLGLGYEMDLASDWNTSDVINAKLTGRTSDPIAVKAKTIGANKGIVNVGADYYLNERWIMNINTSIKVMGTIGA